MSSAAPPLMKQLSTASKCCLTSLPTPFSTTTKSSAPFLRVTLRPIRVFHRSCLSSSSLPSWVSLKKKAFAPLVAQTSDWARQDEEEEKKQIEEKVEDGSNDVKARGSSDEWEGTEEEEEGVIDGGEKSSPGGGVRVLEEEGGEVFPEPPEEAKLFVGNIPYDIDSEGLAKIFEPSGFVEIAEVIYTKGTGQSRGFGFVTMSTVEEAEKAVEMFHRYDLDGRLLTVNKAAPRGSQPERPPRAFEPSYKIYVGNLPWQVDDARLEQVFSEHGKVLNSRVVFDRETNRSRGFGFVTMSSETELNDAIAALNGQSLDGRAIRVSVAEERQRRGSFF